MVDGGWGDRAGCHSHDGAYAALVIVSQTRDDMVQKEDLGEDGGEEVEHRNVIEPRSDHSQDGSGFGGAGFELAGVPCKETAYVVEGGFFDEDRPEPEHIDCPQYGDEH